MGLQLELTVLDVTRPLGLPIELVVPGDSRAPERQTDLGDPDVFSLLVVLVGGRPLGMKVGLVLPDGCSLLFLLGNFRPLVI